MAPGLGFEPRLNGPEPLVLPLHHPGIRNIILNFRLEFLKNLLKNLLSNDSASPNPAQAF